MRQNNKIFSSVQFSHSVMSDSLWPHGPQHARPPCPSPPPIAYSNSCPLSRWCQPNISSSVVPLSSHLQSFPASGSFKMSQFFISGGLSIGVSAWASVLPMTIQDWLPLGLTGWISLQSMGLSRVFSKTTVQKHQFFSNKTLYIGKGSISSPLTCRSPCVWRQLLQDCCAPLVMSRFLELYLLRSLAWLSFARAVTSPGLY